MPHLLVFGPGYAATRLIARLGGDWLVTAVGRDDFGDERRVRPAIVAATHILSSVPPKGERDPVLERYAGALAQAPARWLGYLSSTGVYGDTGGAWVDETAPVGGGRRTARAAADLAWQALRPETRVFRLPGIYGPGRSALDQLRSGRAHRIDLPGQFFSRIHVDDIADGLIASFGRGPPGVYNLADDLPAPQAEVVAHAAMLLGRAPPPFTTVAALLPQARAFYAENRRVANGKAKRLLGWRPAWPTFREGLRSLLEIEAQAQASSSTSQ